MPNPIVITGARGYVGSVLAQRLAGQGHALRLVSRGDDMPGVVGARVEHVRADLRQESAWDDLMEGAGGIVHLSSRTDLRAAEADASQDMDMNVVPVRALVAAARKRGASLPVVFASTVTLYGPNPALPVNEEAPDHVISVYDRHKAICEAILRRATLDNIISACSLRLANVYGFGVTSINSNRGILNAMMKRAIKGESMTLYGAGAYVRDFVHVRDVADAFSAAILNASARDGGSYIIATGQGHSLAQAYGSIAKEAKRQCGRAVPVSSVPEPADLYPIERRDFIGNPERFSTRTGWRPQFDLRAGIADFFMQSLVAEGRAL